MSAETLEMPANETLEQKRDQLISEYEDLALQVQKEKDRIEFEDSGRFPLENYPSFVKLQEQLTQKEKDIQALQGMESVETAGEIVGAKFNALEKGIATQNELSEEKLKQLESEILEAPENIQKLATELLDAGEKLKQDPNSLDLKLALLKKQREMEKANDDLKEKQKVADNIRKGLKLEEERELKMAA